MLVRDHGDVGLLVLKYHPKPLTEYHHLCMSTTEEISYHQDAALLKYYSIVIIHINTKFSSELGAPM